MLNKKIQCDQNGNMVTGTPFKRRGKYMMITIKRL